MYIKNSKFKNTGILFEILTKKITSDTLNNKPSEALKLLKKYFVNTELGKEYRLYESLVKHQNLKEGTANIVLDSILESSRKLNRTTLRKEKYNLVKELREHYDINDLFQIKINLYKPFAALYTLFEIYNNKDITNPKQIIENKTTLMEHLTVNLSSPTNTKEDVLEEFKNYDKDLRILTYYILLEKFNGKYNDLHPKQKNILKEFINSVDNSNKLKEFYNKEVLEIKKLLSEQISKTKDKVLEIKLDEVKRLIPELNKRERLKTDNLIDLMQHYSLLEELKVLNE